MVIWRRKKVRRFTYLLHFAKGQRPKVNECKKCVVWPPPYYCHRLWYQSKARVHIPISNSNLDPIYLAPFQRYGSLNVENREFSLPTPIPAKILGCSLWSRSVVLGSAERGKVGLIIREINFPRIPTYMTTIRQRYRQTDGQTTCLAIPHSATLRAVTKMLNTRFVEKYERLLQLWCGTTCQRRRHQQSLTIFVNIENLHFQSVIPWPHHLYCYLSNHLLTLFYRV